MLHGLQRRGLEIHGRRDEDGDHADEQQNDHCEFSPVPH